MKKTFCVLVLVLICVSGLFATHQIRTSFIPYALQRFSSNLSDEETYTSDYGWGIKSGYYYSVPNGITFGAEVGSLHYILPKERDPRFCESLTGLVKFGYFTSINKEKAVRYFVYAGAGVKIISGKEKINATPLLELETGVGFNLGRNFNLNFAVEPMLSYSEQDSKSAKRTDFHINANVGIGYEF